MSYDDSYDSWDPQGPGDEDSDLFDGDSYDTQFCPNCHAQLFEGQELCPQCGYWITPQSPSRSGKPGGWFAAPASRRLGWGILVVLTLIGFILLILRSM